MKKALKYLPGILFAVYLAVSLLSLNNCTTQKEDKPQSYNSLMKSKTVLLNFLKDKYDAELFSVSLSDIDPGYIGKIVNSRVILDTVVIGARSENGKYFLRAKIKSVGSGDIFAEFGCSREVMNKFRNSKFTSAFIVADISSVNVKTVPAEIDTLNNDSSGIFLLRNAVLTGDCIFYNEYRDPSSV